MTGRSGCRRSTGHHRKYRPVPAPGAPRSIATEYRNRCRGSLKAVRPNTAYYSELQLRTSVACVSKSYSLLFGSFKNKGGRRSSPDQRPPSASVSLISVKLFLSELYFFPDEIRDNRHAVLDL